MPSCLCKFDRNAKISNDFYVLRFFRSYMCIYNGFRMKNAAKTTPHTIPLISLSFPFFFFKLFLFSLLWHLVVVMFTRNHLVDLWNYAVTIFYNKYILLGFSIKHKLIAIA